MKKLITLREAALLLLALLLACHTYAQLPAFTLNATATPQTCFGTGSISFSVTGTNPAATMDYKIYLLPNTTTPVTIVTASPVNNLAAGTYKIVATQSFNGNSNTAEATVTIDNQAVPLVFAPIPTHVRCTNDGKITVLVQSGSATGYEITSGPVTAPIQTSPVFNNLPIGVYEVRVYDSCGGALVSAVQLVAATPYIDIDPVFFESGPLPSCNLITVGHVFSSNSTSDIFFPVTFEYTVFPPGGGTPTVVSHVVATGIDEDNTTYQNIPFYHNQAYSYNLKVTDACGNIFTRNNNLVNQHLIVVAATSLENCSEKSVTLTPQFYVAPYQINFTSAPSGFNPALFNAQHPTFSGPSAVYNMPGGSMPDGPYTVQITDACGHTSTTNFNISAPEITPQVVPQVLGCSSVGSIAIVVPGRNIVDIDITVAPVGYPSSLPHDVSSFITPEGFYIQNIPIGFYTLVFTDSCGDVYTESTTLEPGTANPLLNVQQRPGCAPNEGSVRIRSLDASLISFVITAAPTEFNQTLPYNASGNIAPNGIFFMNSLPAGNYTINTVDQCGVTRNQDIVVEGYEVTQNELDVIELCGSFNLDFDHTSNGDYIESFWVQKLDDSTGNWVHPQTGVPYPEGTLPLASNSREITTGLNINFPYVGTFRILKVFYVYNNALATNYRCFDTVQTFEFESGPKIESAYKFPCADGLTEVAIDATGVAPLTYEIIYKDNAPFPVDNGTQNIFSGLAPGSYVFEVTDGCGSSIPVPLDINALDPLQINSTSLCDGQNGSLSVPQFSFLTYEWFREDDPSIVLSTGPSLEFAPFNTNTHPGTYHVRIISDNPASCINTELTTVVQPNHLPDAGDDANEAVCNDGQQLDLSVYINGEAGGIWADTDGTGALTGSILETSGLAADLYEFKYTVTGDCNITDEAIVLLDLRQRPGAPLVDAVAPVCEGDAIQLSATDVPGATYQWSGPANFTSTEKAPLIAVAGTSAAGNYNVTVTVGDCVSPAANVNVQVNAMPQFTIEGNTLLCEGQSSTLTVVPTNNFNASAANYEWYHDNVLLNANTPSVNIDELGSYSVIVTNQNCIAPVQQIEVIENINAFELVLEHGCEDFEYLVSVVNYPDFPTASYVWEGPSGYTATGSVINITELPAGTYSVTVTDPDGCTAGAQVDVPNTFCKIPKGISPNVDGKNDTWDLSNLNVRDIKIFNRYGLEVYAKENYVNEWHGQSDRGDLPSGTYYYVVSLSTGKKVTGWVYLQTQY